MADDRRLLLTRPVDAPRQTLDEYRAAGGFQALTRAIAESPSAVLDAIEEADLRGRGGAAFPAARKWRIAAAADADAKYVVANGGEHEPGSDKDKFLVERYPHAVLEGLMLAGFATGAEKGWLYLISDMEAPLASAEAAIDELRDAGLLGNNVLGEFSFDVEIHRAPTTYVAGEETAALESIEGQEAKPRKKPPYPGEHGLFGNPTTVNNVETLAHVPLIVREGAAWYRDFGKDGSHGTMLFTLGSAVKSPGVYELEFGDTYRRLIYDLGGGPVSGHAIRGILPALSCRFLGPEHLDTPLTHAAMREAGSSLGCGGVSFVEEGQNVLDRLAEIADFFMAEQCGQCPPCRMETNHLAAIINGVRAGKDGDYAGQITKITGFARGKGQCSLIEMAAAPIQSAVELFAEDFARASGGG